MQDLHTCLFEEATSYWCYFIKFSIHLINIQSFSPILHFLSFFLSPSPSGPPILPSLQCSLSTCWFQSQRVEAKLRTSALSRKRWCHLFERRRARLALSRHTDTVVYTMLPLFQTDSLSYTEMQTQCIPPQLFALEAFWFEINNEPEMF